MHVEGNENQEKKRYLSPCLRRTSHRELRHEVTDHGYADQALFFDGVELTNSVKVRKDGRKSGLPTYQNRDALEERDKLRRNRGGHEATGEVGGEGQEMRRAQMIES